MKNFKFAFSGIIEAVKYQRNMRIHLCFAFYVVIAGFVCRVSRVEWLALLLCIGLVMAAELFNTAIESACDAVTREHSEPIRIAKDAAAGAVLVCAVFSAAVGLIVFLSHGRPALALRFAMEHKLAAGAVIFCLPFWILFIAKTRRSHK